MGSLITRQIYLGVIPVNITMTNFQGDVVIAALSFCSTATMTERYRVLPAQIENEVHSSIWTFQEDKVTVHVLPLIFWKDS